MKNAVIGVVLLATLSACSSPPQPPQPTGEWVPVNQPADQQVSRTASK
jgi:uncharacterized lipoprotein